ncbi:LysR family transcriptional regulator [Enterovirga sp.]|jgi:DNA-binding transcriptional LysR family regulator|uniref:LysR family transcriptional regulator n=1 Tax=Enterovirga sp. TaxID=2026350 RepID=UPI00262CCC7A|nr:LysR family transcriptional regulator [Enterovirga sp.]MDB5592037.1 LysR family transcriptional regulator [Enterovirga sp.]
MLPSPRWDDLQAFLAVARAGRLTAAARRMGIEHTTLSRRIARLESDLGTPLFDRLPTGYDLTVDGQALVPRAEEMERAALGIWSGRPGSETDLSGTVRIGTPEAFGTFCLAERIGELALTHPGLSIELVATPRAFSLSKREADLAIGLSPPVTGRLHARKLGDYELGLYGSRAYLDRCGTPSTPDDLKTHRYIGYIDELVFSPELDYFALALPGLEPSIRISNVITQMTATLSGAGLCILPCFMADRQHELVRVAPKSVRILRAYWMLTHSNLRKLRRIRVAADFVGTIVKDARAAMVPTAA